MGAWSAFLWAYLLGGVTFIPLVVATIFLHAYLTLPHRDDAEPSENEGPDGIVQPADDLGPLQAVQRELKDEGKIKATSSPELEAAAGYFAVCREYTPMGINAKPIERSTPVGSTTVAAPSPSVYQTMYRSIFERKQAAGPLDAKGAGQRPKKAGNVFYVVLRHGHLMLFDDDEQLEVRHVISLAHHEVSIYSGGGVTPEGELFIKRNALCLSRRKDGLELGPDSLLSKPFYLFSENCSAKEDFYFALLRNQEQTFAADTKAPTPLQFDVKHVISLVQRLHSSEEYIQTRWLNAMIGRIFLGLHRTADIENFIRKKLTKKISRVKRPNFLSDITIRKIDTGESAPFFTNVRLKDLTVEGECGIETDVRYNGNFRLEVAAVARIDLGSRIKAREVKLVLAVVLRKLEGHLLFKIKPPPSDRIWFSFQHMPKVEMTIEPIVSSRQITYTVILRQIENRIKEVIAETLVLPFWDDMPFFHTEHKKWRGGIFAGDDAVASAMDPETLAAQVGDVDDVGAFEGAGAPPSPDLPPREKSYSVPVLEAAATTGLFGRKLGSKSSRPQKPTSSSTSVNTQGLDGPRATASSTSIETGDDASAGLRAEGSGSSVDEPKPVVGTDGAHAEVLKTSSSPPGESPAADEMARLSARSQPATPPHGSPHRASVTSIGSSRSSASSGEVLGATRDDEPTPKSSLQQGATSSPDDKAYEESAGPDSPAASTRSTARSQTGLGGKYTLRSGTGSAVSVAAESHSGTQKKITLATVSHAASNAAGAAKRWGLNALQRRASDMNKDGHHGGPEPLDLTKPMGGGRPLPPPGTPLPMPDRKSTVVPVAAPKRKPLPPPALPERAHHDERHDEIKRRPVPPPPLPRRYVRATEQAGDGESILVIAAPLTDSEPGSPSAGGHGEHAPPSLEEGGGEEAHDDAYRHREEDPGALPGPAEDETRPAAQAGEALEPTPLSLDGDADGDDDYSAWMDNTGDDEPLASAAASEGLAH